MQNRGVAEVGLVGVAYELLGIWGGLGGEGRGIAGIKSTDAA